MTRKLSRPETINKTPLSDFAETFLKQGKYLRNWSDRTVRTYRQGLVCLGYTPLTKTGLELWVVSMRERGLTPSTVAVVELMSFTDSPFRFASFSHRCPPLGCAQSVPLDPFQQGPPRYSHCRPNLEDG